MDKQLIQKKFNGMGVALSFDRRRPTRFQRDQLISIDVIENKKGEHFVLENPADFQVPLRT